MRIPILILFLNLSLLCRGQKQLFKQLDFTKGNYALYVFRIDPKAEIRLESPREIVVPSNDRELPTETKTSTVNDNEALNMVLKYEEFSELNGETREFPVMRENLLYWMLDLYKKGSSTIASCKTVFPVFSDPFFKLLGKPEIGLLVGRGFIARGSWTRSYSSASIALRELVRALPFSA